MTIVLGALLGSFLTLVVTFYFKERDIYLSSLNSAKLIDLALCEQISTLTNVLVFVSNYEGQIAATNKALFQKTMISPSLLSITSEMIDKLLALDEIRQFPGNGKIIIGLTIAQRINNEIYNCMDEYNRSISPEKLEKIELLTKSSPIRKGLELEVTSYFELIAYKCKELKSLQKMLKEKFDLMCQEVYSEKSGFCNSASKFYRMSIKRILNDQSYKPIKLDDSVTKATDIFND